MLISRVAPFALIRLGLLVFGKNVGTIVGILIRAKGRFRRAYTHNAEFRSERVLMMQAWAYLNGLRKILPLTQARAAS
jgi:hypothetical protein